MQEDITLICYHTENFDQLKNDLEQSQIAVTYIRELQNATLTLEPHCPTFLLLDMDVENSGHFLQMISRSNFFDPPPYILIATSPFKSPDRVAMLNLGADACVEKPIDSQEIIALIHAILRRAHRIVRTQIDQDIYYIEHRDMRIYPLSHIVTMRGEIAALSPKEFDILHLLAKKAGTVLRKETIYEEVWKEKHECAAMRVTDSIHTLRLKLGLDSKNLDYIQTVHGVGYRFAKPE